MSVLLNLEILISQILSVLQYFTVKDPATGSQAVYRKKYVLVMSAFDRETTAV